MTFSGGVEKKCWPEMDWTNLLENLKTLKTNIAYLVQCHKRPIKRTGRLFKNKRFWLGTCSDWALI